MAFTIPTFIIVLGILIFVHELGHFLLAKKTGAGVERFSLGFGPKIIGKKIGETEYVISAIPLGGYVKLHGEDPREECEHPEKSFSDKPVHQRLMIVAAGPLFNLFFAVFVYMVIYTIGVPILKSVVGEVKSDSPAMTAGIKAGDEIVEIDGKKIRNWGEMADIIFNSPGKSLTVTVERNSQNFVLHVTPDEEKTKNIFGEEVTIGLIGIVASGDTYTQRYDPFTASYKGIEHSFSIISLTVKSIVWMIQGRVSAENISGPLGIAKMVGDEAKRGLLPLANLVALLSISLGILNLLPIPVLDGGHILFFLIEIIRGKPLSLKKREIAQQIGIALLITLMVFAFYNDIMRIFMK